MKKMPLWLAPLVTVVVLFGTVEVAMATNTWVASGKQTVVAGQALAPDELKGWMTVRQASDGLGMPVADLISLIAPPPGVTLSPDTAFKDVEGVVPGFELSTLRESLKARRGTTSPTGASPGPASDPANTAPSASPVVSSTSPDATAPSRGPGTPSPAMPHVPSGTRPGTGAGTGSAEAGQSITGQMSLRQVAEAAGIEPATLVAEAGLPADVSLDAPLRSLKDQVPGFEVSQVRNAVERLR